MKNNVFGNEYAKYYNLFYKDKNYEKECNFLEEVFKKHSLFKIKDVLDLGCGTGIHARYLASRGYNILGLDLSKEMIEIANLRTTPKCKFTVGNISNFKLNKKFDACITMFATLGYLIKNKQIKSYLNSVKKHLKSNGLLILDCWNGPVFINELPKSRTKIIKSGNLKVIRKSFPKLDPFNHLCDIKFNFQIFKNNLLIKSYEELHKVRFFFLQELKKYIENSGFELLEVCKAFKLGSKIDKSSWNMILICRLKK